MGHRTSLKARWTTALRPRSTTTILTADNFGGDKLWDAVFTVRPERLTVSKDALNDLLGSFFFKARKDVAKVIFMATPQRGSNLATNWLGRFGSRLVHLSGDWSVENRLIARVQKAFIRPQMYRYFARGGSSSIESLSPKHPLLAAFEGLVPDKRIPCYWECHADTIGRYQRWSRDVRQRQPSIRETDDYSA